MWRGPDVRDSFFGEANKTTNMRHHITPFLLNPSLSSPLILNRKIIKQKQAFTDRDKEECQGPPHQAQRKTKNTWTLLRASVKISGAKLKMSVYFFSILFGNKKKMNYQMRLAIRLN